MATIEKGTGTMALAAFDTTAELKFHEFGRPSAGPNEVEIDVSYCGMCHSDLHATNGDWGMSSFPMAPGHEIAGLVRAVGSKVTNFKVGDRVGVGCMVESCNSCGLCSDGLEQHCPCMIQTYGSSFPENKGDNFKDAVGYHTNGGYTSSITVRDHFVFNIPDTMELSAAAPLLCAGITTYSPLKRHILQKGGGKGKTVGVVGFGGLGHVAVKIAKAMGVDKVVCFSRSGKKASEAEALGATLMVHSDEEQLKAAVRTIDVIIDTVSHSHPIAPIMGTLKVGGAYVLLGGVPTALDLSAMPLLFNRHSVEGSLIGGVPETQEMLDFCSKHNVLPDIEIIHAKDASAHFKAMAAGTSGSNRVVIDMSTLGELKP